MGKSTEFQISYTYWLAVMWSHCKKHVSLKHDVIVISVVTNTHFQVFKYFGKYLVSDEYLNTI